MTETRFITNQLKGAKVLLHNWTALVPHRSDLSRTAIADAKTKPTVRVKIQNHQKKLNVFRFRYHTVMY